MNYFYLRSNVEIFTVSEGEIEKYTFLKTLTFYLTTLRGEHILLTF